MHWAMPNICDVHISTNVDLSRFYWRLNRWPAIFRCRRYQHHVSHFVSTIFSKSLTLEPPWSPEIGRLQLGLRITLLEAKASAFRTKATPGPLLLPIRCHMDTARWVKPLVTNSRPRRTFGSWKIPDLIRRQYDVQDGVRLDVTLLFGRERCNGQFLVSSGGELHVGAAIAKRIKIYAQHSPNGSVQFRMETFSSAWKDIDAEEKSLKSLPQTQREQIIAARLGQGLFRNRLMRFYGGKCAVTGIAVPELLRASHIKPWRDSNNTERLCVDNGILLVANLDAAFDAHLISFSDEGALIFHKNLGPQPRLSLGIVDDRLRKPPSLQQTKYLLVHRQATTGEPE